MTGTNGTRLLIVIWGYSLFAVSVAHKAPAATSAALMLVYFAAALAHSRAWQALHGLLWPSLLVIILVPFFQIGFLDVAQIRSYYQHRVASDLHPAQLLFLLLYLPFIYIISTLNYYELLRASLLSNRSVTVWFLRIILPIVDLRQRILERYMSAAEMLAYRGFNLAQPIAIVWRSPIWLPMLVRSVIIDAIDRGNYLATRHIDVRRYKPLNHGIRSTENASIWPILCALIFVSLAVAALGVAG